jgi:hypothetical protein
MGDVLVLRTCNADMTSYGGFKWPESGPAECPDWSPEPECGNGLHGFLWGEGSGRLANWSADAKWLVVQVDGDCVVDLKGKVKFPRCDVIFCGGRLEATAYLAANGGQGRAIVGGTATAGDRGTATAGDYGTATAGYRGTATAGNRGTATAGDRGTATAGDYGTATAGNRGTATAGDYGTIQIYYWCDSTNRQRVVTGYVGENGINPNVAYKLDNARKFVEAK